ncbi:MAG: hypothetical protein KJO91_10870 [Gammaproteobacteria bacterium]|nr:hypothetical protein [Gammaproteobacteria bacterium]
MNTTIGEVTTILVALVVVGLAIIFIVPFPFFLIGWGLTYIPEAAGWFEVAGYFANAAAGFAVVISISVIRMLLGD